MNLPMTPSIVVDGDGVTHAFWYQEAYDDCLNFTGDSIYYKTRQGGVWTDRSSILGGYKGPWSRLALDRFGAPAFVWSERWIWPDDIGAAIFEPGAGAEDSLPAVPVPLIAMPNPFTDSVVLRLAGEGPLALAILDTSGRIVRHLVGATRGAARIAGVHWDGRDDAGRDVPAGVYWARLTRSAGQRTISIVRIE